MALSLVALVPGFATLAITQYQINQSRHAEIEDMAVRSAKQAASELDRIVIGIKSLLIAMSHAPEVRDMNDAGCKSYIDALQPELPYLAGLSILDLGGHSLCGLTPPASTGDSLADRPYFQQALGGREPVIGTYTIGRTSHRPVLPIAMALRDKNGQVEGVIVAGLDLIWLGDTLKARGLAPGGSLTVADRNGTIIARQPLSERFLGTNIPAPYIRLLNAPQAGWEEVTSQDGTRRVLGFVPVSEPPMIGLYISAGLSAASSFDSVNKAARIGAALAVTGALATLLATWVIGDRMFVSPIRKVTSALRLWRAGDRAARTHYRADSGEVGELGAEFDRLMDELDRAREQRELLAGELEHRVKNTLATVNALAVSTMDRPEAGKELLPAFLARLNALAQTHEILMREHWESADLEQLLTGVLRPLIGEFGSRAQLAGPALELPPAEALGLTMVVHELCTNALKYGSLGSADGRVAITWRVEEKAEKRLMTMTWREAGGPPVGGPRGKTGFGTRMIGRALGGFGSATLDYDPAGLICRIEIALTAAMA